MAGAAGMGATGERGSRDEVHMGQLWGLVRTWPVHCL